MGRTVSALLLALLLAVAAGGTFAPASGGKPRLVDVEPEDCTEQVPASYSTAIGGRAALAIDATILLDGVEKVDAEKVVARANVAYRDLSLTIVPTFQRFIVKPDSVQRDEFGNDVPAIDVTKLVAAAKLFLGGTRPVGSDVVYVLTTKDVYLQGDRDVAGWAECIGGVRYPARAFAAGEVLQSFTTGPLNFYIDGTAKVLGHEIGHLLGAHHHYGNCAQGAGLDDVVNREPAVCTLMFGYIDLQSLDFGVVDGAVVRGHAETYAAP